MKALFPQVPSFIELEILSFVNYCDVCDIHDNKQHPIKLCLGCDKHICYSYDDNIWSLNQSGKEICQECRRKIVRSNKPFIFISEKKYNIHIKNGFRTKLFQTTASS